MKLLRSLKFQIGATLLLIVLLFIGIFSISQMALKEQRSYNTLLNITARLQHTAQSIINLGMNYAMNPPADPQAEQRDIKVYYQEMRNQIQLFDEITNGFMSEHFAPSLTNLGVPFTPALDPAVHAAVQTVETTWASFKQGLEQSLGMEQQGPDLASAANFITSAHQPLGDAIDTLRVQIQHLTDKRLDQVNNLQWIALAIVIVLTLGILAWFFAAILRPLGRAAGGFQHVAQGDFGYQVPVYGHNELGQMSAAFNQLSSRLHAIFQLIDQIQQGSDLDDTLCFVAEQFPALLPLDWVGALFVGGEGSTIILEKSYQQGQPVITGRNRFQLRDTLLEQALENDQVLHIPDMKRTAENNPQYEFLNHMMDLGLCDAIFLPVTGQSPIPGVLAFATRKAGSYSPEHLELLANIAKLITHSFGRTVKLAEHTRLAAIGSFASGIAHEIRSPLSTISMALEYLQHADLPPAAGKRVTLAHEESGRITRLLEEILLYAKPLKLEFQPLEMHAFVKDFILSHQELAERRNQRFKLAAEVSDCPIMGDRDRLTQVLINLANNAVEAAPEHSTITWRLRRNDITRLMTLEVSNQGTPITDSQLERLFTPFFTTKPQGTGLGLPIVKRMVEAHGGDIRIQSLQTETRVSMHIPLI